LSIPSGAVNVGPERYESLDEIPSAFMSRDHHRRLLAIDQTIGIESGLDELSNGGSVVV